MKQQLSLTPFEEYMYMDRRPAYPMSCFLKLTFRGRPDLETLEKALENALERHPLLSCGVAEDSHRGFYWQKSDRPVQIASERLPEGRLFPRSSGIDLSRSPALKISLCRETESHLTSLVFEFHHSACDAAGADRFVGDLLVEYAALRSGRRDETGRCPVDPETLAERADFKMTAGEFLRNIPGSVMGIPRTVKFLGSRVLPMVGEKPRSEAAAPSPDFPAVLVRHLDAEKTRTIRWKAKAREVTVNDLLLRATFLAVKQWRNPLTEKGVFRIAVPMNLRTEKHRRTPAANIVSMVFMDRKPSRISGDESFLDSVHREMESIKRRKLGLTFLRGLSVYRKGFGSFSKMVDQDRCWTTATVSNLGPVFADLPFPQKEDALRIDDDLELVAVDSVPPIRHLSALGMCVLTFADRMTIDMQYDADKMTPGQAEWYFDLFLRYFLSK